MLTRHRLLLGLTLALLLSSTITSVSIAEDELRLASGLRERRLFEQAEYVCRQALNDLADAENQAAEQTALIVELIRIRSDQARFASFDRRDEFWHGAKQVAERFLNENPQHPRKAIVQLQAALVDLDRLQLFEQEREFGVLSDLSRDQALDLSRGFRESLRHLDQEISNQLRDARSEGNGSEAMTVDELTGLQRNLRFQAAHSGLLRASLYENDGNADSLNRASALSEVLEELKDLQRVNQPGSDLWWRSQLALAKCQRRLRDYDNAQVILERAGDPALRRHRRKWHGLILAEQAELLLARGLTRQVDLDLAVKLLLAIDRTPVPSASLDWLALNLVAETNRVVDSQSRKQELQEQANRRAELIARQHGRWWGTRARQLIARAFEDESQHEAIAKRFKELFQLGLTEMNAKRFMQASVAFDQAASIAKETGDKSAWRTCQIQSGTALEQMGQHNLAASKLLETSREDSEHPSAASLHLRGIWNMAQQAPANDEQDSSYMNAMLDHLNRWPKSQTADRVRVWLGNKQISEGEFSSAAQTLLEVSKDSEYRTEAVHSAVTALEKSADRTAIAALNALINERPRDVVPLVAKARMQTKFGLKQKEVALDEALKSWRQLARRLKPESDRWFEAKFNVARLLFTDGKYDEAKELMNYLSALPSGWSKCSFARQLNELQRTMQVHLAEE